VISLFVSRVAVLEIGKKQRPHGVFRLLNILSNELVVRWIS
jgi:hypothetical protein